MPEHRSVILDMDLGIDDAVALLYLASRPNVTIAAAGSVHGNTPADLAAGNLRRVLALAGLPEVPVARGARWCRSPARRTSPPRCTATTAWATRLPRTTRRLATTCLETAPEQIIRMAHAAPGRYDILATGPLTNLGVALVLEPELPALIRSVVIMGGSAAYGGNMSAVAEANIWHDPEAAQPSCSTPRGPSRWSASTRRCSTMLDEDAIARLAAGAGEQARFVTAILEHYLGFYEMLTRVAARARSTIRAPPRCSRIPTLVTRALHGGRDRRHERRRPRPDDRGPAPGRRPGGAAAEGPADDRHGDRRAAVRRGPRHDAARASSSGPSRADGPPADRLRAFLERRTRCSGPTPSGRGPRAGRARPRCTRRRDSRRPGPRRPRSGRGRHVAGPPRA